MGGVLMKSKTTISYVILKYDEETNSIFTKTSNNDKNTYREPSFGYEPNEKFGVIDNDLPNEDYSLDDMKSFVVEELSDFKTNIDEAHIFLPFVTATTVDKRRVYNYTAVILESDKNEFSSMNYESWHRVKYNSEKKVWSLAWESGLTDPVDFIIHDVASENYAINPNGKDDQIDFCNVMHFVAEQTKDFPILGLLSGSKFTLNQVLRYQELLGIDGEKVKTATAFENQYSGAIQVLKDDHASTMYKIKSEYL